MAEGVITAKPEALQPRAEAEAEHRSEMPTVRGPDRGHVQACLAVARGPQQRACANIMVVVRGPNRGHVCTGMPSCGESAHQRTRVGQSRHHERCIAIVAIVVTVIVVFVVLLSCCSCSCSCGCSRGCVAAPHGSGSGSCCAGGGQGKERKVVWLFWLSFPMKVNTIIWKGEADHHNFD